MSEQNQQQSTEQELDARGAAFAQRPDTFTLLRWQGPNGRVFEYEVRPTTLAFQKEMEASKEAATDKAVRTIIACTYWPPGTTMAGTAMFNAKDKDTILQSYGDPGSVWLAILKAAGEQVKKAAAKGIVEEIKGNSEASPGSSPA
jgi:hypothetical protein